MISIQLPASVRTSVRLLSLAALAALGVASNAINSPAQAPAVASQHPALPSPPPALSGKTPMAVVDGRAVRVSHYDPTRMLRLAFVLALPHPAEEQQFLEDVQNKQSPHFHQFLSAGEWNARFSPSAEDEQAVLDWAKSRGLTITNRFPNRLVVDAEAPAGVIENALHVTIDSYRLPAVGNKAETEGRIAFSNDRDPELPSSLVNVVDSVLGLNSIEEMAPIGAQSRAVSSQDYVPGPVEQEAGSIERDAPSLAGSEDAAENSLAPEITKPPAGYWTPLDLWASTGYDYLALMNQGHCCNPLKDPKNPPETSIAVAAYGDVLFSDINGFATEFSLAENVQKYLIDGGYKCNNSQGNDPNCTETTLDTEWSMATANSKSNSSNTGKIYVYEGVNSQPQTIVDVYGFMVKEGYARVMSTSWGCPESTASGTNGCTADTMKSIDKLVAQMVGQGWTIVAASGDQGATSTCGNALGITFPASDPNIVAVGGTELTEGTSSAKYEVAWSGSTAKGACATNGGGSTGGPSDYWPVPSYQAYLGSKKRTTPDVALDSFYGHDVYFNGGWIHPGGTSIAAPMFAGFFAQENAYLLKLGYKCGAKGTAACAPLGNANYPIYHEGRYKDAAHSPFYDIATGCNSNDITVLYKLKAFCAGTSYDEVTGWGSANMLQLAWAINWELAAANGVPYVTFTGPAKNKWYHANQIIRWKVNDFPGAGLAAAAATGIAGFTQGWDSLARDPIEEPHGGTGNLFYDGPEFPNGASGCLSLEPGHGCGGGVSQGCHTVYVHGWNNEGETTAGQTAYPETYGKICYDTTPPIATYRNSSDPNAQGWYKIPVTVELDGLDPGTGASGIEHIYFGINDQCGERDSRTCGIYSAPFKLTTDGVYTIQWFAVDKAGNASTEPYERVWLDQTPPVTTASVIGTSIGNGAYAGTVNFTMQATDNLSDVLYTYYQIDGGTATAYDIGSTPLNQIPVTAIGSHTFTYWSVDYARNTETAHTINFTIATATTTTLTVSPNPALYGQNVTLTAHVTSATGTPGGSLKFFNGTTVMGFLTLVNGQASLSTMYLPVGTSSLTAVFQGGGSYAPSTSAAVNEVIQSTQGVNIVLTSSENPANGGDAVTFTATITADVSGIPTGSVTFMDGATMLGSSPYSYPKATLATSQLTIGTHSITAIYSGDANYGPATSAPLSQVVNAAPNVKPRR